MAGYYILGIVFCLFALIIAAIGILTDNFPSSRDGGRGLVVLAFGIAATTLVVLLSVTHVEHPREDAKAEAAAKKAEAPRGKKPGAAAAKGGTVAVSEKEYAIALSGGNTLKPGNYTFDVTNVGKVPHDLAVEDGKETKTPLIDASKSAKLDVELKPGKYKLYCTVPGHEQLGMKQEVTVR